MWFNFIAHFFLSLSFYNSSFIFKQKESSREEILGLILLWILIKNKIYYGFNEGVEKIKQILHVFSKIISKSLDGIFSTT